MKKAERALAWESAFHASADAEPPRGKVLSSSRSGQGRREGHKGLKERRENEMKKNGKSREKNTKRGSRWNGK